jgi:hypothetical protein
MNEQEWLACTDPGEMLDFVERRASSRKLQLFAAACCRRARRLSSDSRHQSAIEAAERAANGLISAAEFERVLQPVVELWAVGPPYDERGPFDHMTAATRHLGGGRSSRYAARFAAVGLAELSVGDGGSNRQAARQAEEAIQCSLLREIFGSPFHPFEFDSSWLSNDGRPAVALAREIDAEARFEAMPALADALERAGCHDPAVRTHCLAPSTHVRGCWVVDALLRRETAVCKGLTTEADWRTCEHPDPLLHFLRDKGTDRQWRLFAVACCRRIDRLITDKRSRLAIEVAARYAEGTATEQDLAEARAAAQQAQDEAHFAEWSAEAEENFRLTPRYAAVSRDLFAARAARSAVGRDPRASDAEPGSFDATYWGPSSTWAVAAVRWSVYADMGNDIETPDMESAEQADAIAWMTEHGKLGSGPPGARVEEAANVARMAESRAQCEFLHHLFGEFLGPTSEEGEWCPCGEAAPVSEWWCRLPTPRQS